MEQNNKWIRYPIRQSFKKVIIEYGRNKKIGFYICNTQKVKNTNMIKNKRYDSSNKISGIKKHSILNSYKI